jgi:hypothetical protein
MKRFAVLYLLPAALLVLATTLVKRHPDAWAAIIARFEGQIRTASGLWTWLGGGYFLYDRLLAQKERTETELALANARTLTGRVQDLNAGVEQRVAERKWTV